MDYYGIFHEANHPKYWEGDWDELMELFILPAARAIRDYSEETGDHKIVSTAGLSPSRNCKEWYDVQLEYPELMGMIDNFALNLSDFNNGWGGGLLTWVSSVWDQMEYMDERLNEEGYFDKGIVAAESWVCWDGKRTPHGPEGSGDTVESTLRILGECLQRGLGLTNLPWADNNSPWTMGLTKRIDYILPQNCSKNCKQMATAFTISLCPSVLEHSVQSRRSGLMIIPCMPRSIFYHPQRSLYFVIHHLKDWRSAPPVCGQSSTILDKKITLQAKSPVQRLNCSSVRHTDF